MNHLKKLLSYIVTMAMVFTLTGVGIGAVHAEDGYTLTLQNNGLTPHTFEVYQVFTGDLKDNTLSNIKWGNGITEAGQTALGSASAQAESLIDNNHDLAVARARTFAENLVTNNYLQSGREVTVKQNEPQDVTKLAAGYYLVKDKAESQKGQVNGAVTSYILKVVKNTTATPKLELPTVTKKVKDKNDTEGTTTDWQDSADYDIGDAIDYKIDGTLPGNYDKYASYEYKFTDTMSPGLTYNGGATLYVVNDGKETKIENSGTEPYYTETSRDGIVTWSFSNLKALTNVTSSSIIRVKYSATLNQNAVIGAKGNPNTVNLTYSNNPYNSGEGETGKTPDDNNIVFTYKAVVNKVDKDNNPLKGAGFTLQKKVNGTYTDVKTLNADDTTTTFTFSGLDDGDYKLIESTTPAGYNTIKPVTFKISATHDIEKDNPALTELKVENTTATFTSDKDAGSLTTNVVNNKGSILPETGGMGTTLLYVLGGVLVALAAAYVIYTKKHEKAE